MTSYLSRWSSFEGYNAGYPTEFDLIIHKADAKPEPFTHAFNGKDVYSVIEVKTKGIIGNVREEIPTAYRKIRENFDKIKKQFPDIVCCYLTLRETINPKKPKSTNYGKLARKHLEPYRFCCLSDTKAAFDGDRYTGQIEKGEWRSFVRELTK